MVCYILRLTVLLFTGFLVDGHKYLSSPEIAIKNALGLNTPLTLKNYQWTATVNHGAVSVILKEEKTLSGPSRSFQISSSGAPGMECSDIKKRNPKSKSGIYKIRLSNKKRVSVYCDMTTDGGGWTVFQRRMDGSVDFQRGWHDYKVGFGNLSTEFWLGNDAIHAITANGSHHLRIDMETFSGNKLFAKYTNFSVGDENSGYTLTVGGFSGNAGDSMAHSNEMEFTTKDKDQDSWSKNCAVYFSSPFWHRSCTYTMPNGHYIRTGSYTATYFKYGITWYHYKNTYNIAMKTFTMMVRRA